MSDRADVLVIGSGVAGLAAARELSGAGARVLVLDKGRRPGGRLATRELGGGARADHGAQFFTARSGELRRLVDEWVADGAARLWCNGFGHDDGHPRYCAPGGMAGLAAHLAAGLQVRQSVHVERLRREGTLWRAQWPAAHGRPAGEAAAERVILTAPLPQAAALLGGEAAVPEIDYEPVVALLLALDGPGAVPAPGGVQLADDPHWSWVGDNLAKGASELPALTLHTRPALARSLLGTGREEIAQRLAPHAGRWSAGAHVLRAEAHVWRFAAPSHTHPDRFLALAGGAVLLAGDAFDGPRVEGALLSGLAAARALLAPGGAPARG